LQAALRLAAACKMEEILFGAGYPGWRSRTRSDIKQIPPAKVAETLNLKVDQVYLIKHRLTKIFEEALKDLETKLG